MPGGGNLPILSNFDTYLILLWQFRRGIPLTESEYKHFKEYCRRKPVNPYSSIGGECRHVKLSDCPLFL
jgi:hypothetical protein